MVDLKKIGNDILEIKKLNGWSNDIESPNDWSDPYKVPTTISLIHSEVSEALESFRKNDIEHFSEEMSDIIIRVIGCTHALGIDIESEIHKKIEKNRSRGYHHGGDKRI